MTPSSSCTNPKENVQLVCNVHNKLQHFRGFSTALRQTNSLIRTIYITIVERLAGSTFSSSPRRLNVAWLIEGSFKPIRAVKLGIRAAMLLNNLSCNKGNLKPVLTSLNGDNSWLVSIPRPLDERATAQKAYFHIVSDAWLVGPANTFHSWLISISLTQTPAAKHGGDVEAMAKEIEAATGLALSPTAAMKDVPLIDLIIINANGHDHLHEATLRTFNPDIPVMAVKDCVAELQSLNRFVNATTYPDLAVGQNEWQSLHPGGQLPSWLHIFRIGNHLLNFATAIAWTHKSESCEGIIYSPHGLRLEDPITQTFLRLQPSLSIIAMLHALHDSFAAGRRTTLGVAGGLALERAIKPKYWVQTHDQPLDYCGIVMKLLRVTDVPRTLQSGLDAENRGDEKGAVSSITKPNFIAVANGSCFVLE